MAEGKGFEPPKGVSSLNDLANRRLQPLGHPSAIVGMGILPTAYAPSQYRQVCGLSNHQLKVFHIASTIAACGATCGERLTQKGAFP